MSTSLELADSAEAVVLVRTDTDLLVMLVARTPPNAKLFLLRPSMNTKPSKVFNISAIQQAVRDRKQNLLLLHAMTGSGDITSALHRQSKKRAIWLLMSNDDIPGYEVKVFNSETLSLLKCLLPVKSLFLLCMEVKG